VATQTIWLDYGKAGENPLLLHNLSGVAAVGPCLWTVSDEGRSVECLAASHRGYKLHRQVMLDDLFPDVPGRDTTAEADLESVDVAHGRLWVCGSHCRVRRQPNPKRQEVDARVRARPSRCVLGSARLTGDGEVEAPGTAVPFRGRGSVRRRLLRNDFIAPFRGLPSKENGLDIEGLLVFGNRLLLGLRGPVVDSTAIIADIGRTSATGLFSEPVALHFLDLHGLGVRDLARWDKDVLVLAGPVSASDGPFRLFRWKPRRSQRVQKPELVHKWPTGLDHPEGICALERDGKTGLLVLCDTANPARVRGTRYRADWLAARNMSSR
jgi:hypothetical protein